MLIDGQKWACEACIRGHRVTSCKHHGMFKKILYYTTLHYPVPFPSLHRRTWSRKNTRNHLYSDWSNIIACPDRPLIRIKRKGRPFATCTVCQSTPCTAPSEHARAKREAELKTPTKVTQTQQPLLPPKHNRGRKGNHEHKSHLDALFSSGIPGKQRGQSRCAIGKVLMLLFKSIESSACQTLSSTP